MWDGKTEKFVATLGGHVAAVYRFVWSAYSRLLVSASKDSTLKVYLHGGKKGYCLSVSKRHTPVSYFKYVGVPQMYSKVVHHRTLRLYAMFPVSLQKKIDFSTRALFLIHGGSYRDAKKCTRFQHASWYCRFSARTRTQASGIAIRIH